MPVQDTQDTQDTVSKGLSKSSPLHGIVGKRKKKVTRRVRDRIKGAVKMKLESVEWSVIARRYNYKNAHSCRIVLMDEHRDLWDTYFEAGLRQAWIECGIAARATQRELIQPTHQAYDPETKTMVETPTPLSIRQSAAHSLLHHERNTRAMDINVQAGAKDGTGGVLATALLTGVFTQPEDVLDGNVTDGAPAALPAPTKELSDMAQSQDDMSQDGTHAPAPDDCKDSPIIPGD